jgi:hypothetical protein
VAAVSPQLSYCRTGSVICLGLKFEKIEESDIGQSPYEYQIAISPPPESDETYSDFTRNRRLPSVVVLRRQERAYTRRHQL